MNTEKTAISSFQSDTNSIFSKIRRRNMDDGKCTSCMEISLNQYKTQMKLFSDNI